eukprot:3242438-Amphidinium_carterae.1
MKNTEDVHCRYLSLSCFSDSPFLVHTHACACACIVETQWNYLVQTSLPCGLEARRFFKPAVIGALGISHCVQRVLRHTVKQLTTWKACDILLHGVGIRPEMCEASCSEGAPAFLHSTAEMESYALIMRSASFIQRILVCGCTRDQPEKKLEVFSSSQCKAIDGSI